MAKEYHLMSPEELKDAWALRFNKDIPESIKKILSFFKERHREEPGVVTRPGGLEREDGRVE